MEIIYSPGSLVMIKRQKFLFYQDAIPGFMAPNKRGNIFNVAKPPTTWREIKDKAPYLADQLFRRIIYFQLRIKLGVGTK